VETKKNHKETSVKIPAVSVRAHPEHKTTAFLFEPNFSMNDTNGLDDHGSVRHNTNLIEMTNKMQLCRTIYYSIVQGTME